MAKINIINEHILPIFPINFINILAKTIKYKEYFNIYISKTRMSDLAEIWELSLVCLFLSTIGPTLISNRTTSVCLSYHLNQVNQILQLKKDKKFLISFYYLNVSWPIWPIPVYFNMWVPPFSCTYKSIIRSNLNDISGWSEWSMALIG